MTLIAGGYVTDLTFDGHDLQPADHSLVMWIVRGLNDVALVRGADQVVPGLAGRLPRGRKKDIRQIELAGFVLASGIDVGAAIGAFRQTISDLQAWFDPEDGPSVLSCTLEDGATATINARVVPPILVEEQVASHVARLSIALESVDPDWVITPAGS